MGCQSELTLQMLGACSESGGFPGSKVLTPPLLLWAALGTGLEEEGGGEDHLTAFEEDSIPLVARRPCENPTEAWRGPLCTGPWEHWDYVFVADLRLSPKQRDRQQQYLQQLQRRGFRCKVAPGHGLREMKDSHNQYFGIQAMKEVFLPYCKLLMEPEGPVLSALPAEKDLTLDTTRICIMHTFINNIKTADGETFEHLKKDHVFQTGFFLHKVGACHGAEHGTGPGREANLRKWAQWRSMFCKQPIDDIRSYFGEKVALYFAWLGWYTLMLIPAALMGLAVFLSGFALFNASQISKEICEANHILMCPRGDHLLRYQRLSDTCTFAKLTHLFDNEATVLFAIFMALWATVFLEFWKRKRSEVVLHWHLYGWDEDEEEMMLELIFCPEYQPKKHRHSYLYNILILALSLVMICFMIGMAHFLVIYRVLVAALFSHWASPVLAEQVTTAVVVSGALMHYVTIVIMTKVNRRVALKLCEFESPRTVSERESKLTVKFFMLQFFAHFSSLVYIAFILGRINGHPGKSVRLAGLWKLEECHLSGCMMDLFVQMATIMGLKQTLSNCVEYLGPWLHNKYRWYKHGPPDPNPELKDWQSNYLLGSVTIFSLFDEFMEMMMQYGFTTIFVAAFPLAPLLALFSNVVEIRLDAIKMVWLQQRLVPRKAKDIGTWLQVLETIGVLAVIVNGLVIAFTSEFIPRMVYKYRYGPCQHRASNPPVDCLTGYINHSLSVFHTKDFEDPLQIEGSEKVTECRYRDYRNPPPDYNLSEQFWFLLAIRMAFLIIFEHVALCIKLIAAWFVPDVPGEVSNTVLESKFLRVQEKMKYQQHRTPQEGASPPSASSSGLKTTAVRLRRRVSCRLGHKASSARPLSGLRGGAAPAALTPAQCVPAADLAQVSRPAPEVARAQTRQQGLPGASPGKERGEKAPRRWGPLFPPQALILSLRPPWAPKSNPETPQAGAHGRSFRHARPRPPDSHDQVEEGRGVGHSERPSAPRPASLLLLMPSPAHESHWRRRTGGAEKAMPAGFLEATGRMFWGHAGSCGEEVGVGAGVLRVKGDGSAKGTPRGQLGQDVDAGACWSLLGGLSRLCLSV
ncbi:PREDICTED: anoctamin-9 [Elephantulus edwardii]|uniref:anoctamin-9 n=1 Tax=Elephantulus edwardii TaxID=28737 RepID=UPI0003F0D93B|nr:PREDICTED: anoctamin-9 [Elephantulus edwardii]